MAILSDGGGGGKNRISRFWEKSLEEAFEAADGDAIQRLTDGMITALASSEGTEFWFQASPIQPCLAGGDNKRHLARELRRLALRCRRAADRLEGGHDA